MVVQRSGTGLFSCTGLIVACLQTVDFRAQDELQILIPVQNQGVPFCCDFSTATPTWGDLFESCFKAQSSKLERLFSLKRGKRDFRALSFELSEISPQEGLAVHVICYTTFFSFFLFIFFSTFFLFGLQRQSEFVFLGIFPGL